MLSVIRAIDVNIEDIYKILNIDLMRCSLYCNQITNLFLQRDDELVWLGS